MPSAADRSIECFAFVSQYNNGIERRDVPRTPRQERFAIRGLQDLTVCSVKSFLVFVEGCCAIVGYSTAGKGVRTHFFTKNPFSIIHIKILVVINKN